MEYNSLSLSIAGCFGNEHVSEELAHELNRRIPLVTFIRISLRCGSGLFLSSNFLRPGPLIISILSLKNSLAGIVMKEGKACTLDLVQRRVSSGLSAPEHGAPVSVACFPVGVHSRIARLEKASTCSDVEGQPSYIGVLHLGLTGPMSNDLQAAVQELCNSLGEYLLLISLTKIQDMAKVMELPLGECFCCDHNQEDVDHIFERCRQNFPHQGPSGSSAPSQIVFAEAVAGAESGDCQLSSGPTVDKPHATELSAGVEADTNLQGPLPEVENPAPAALLNESAMELKKNHGLPPSSVPSQLSLPEIDLAGKQESQHIADVLLQKQARASTSELQMHGEALDGREQDDPKVSARRAGQLALAAGLRQGLLLNFADPGMEQRFRREQARDLIKLDLLFHLVYLVAFTCSALLDPPGVLGASTNTWFAWVLLLPVLTILSGTTSYVRWRSHVLIPFTLLHMAHYRLSVAPTLLSVLRGSSLHKLPWLLRCTGAEALLVFPLGNKVPFSVFFPVHIVSMLFMMSLLPGPCNAITPQLSAAAACIPCGWELRSLAALLGAGCVLPVCAIYFTEAHARNHFSQVVQSLQA